MWRQTTQDEMDVLLFKGIWSQLISSLNVTLLAQSEKLSIKYQFDGTIDQYKAQLVAKGYTKTYGIAFFEMFFPVMNLITIRINMSLVIHKDWPLHQLHIKNAFYEDPDEIVYMQPPGFESMEEYLKMCFLKKAIYRIKQDRHGFVNCLRFYLSMGFICLSMITYYL